MRFFNWVMPSLGVAADELRPDSEYVGRILTAASDIRLCEGIFDGWIAQLNRCAVRHFFILVAYLVTITESQSTPKN